MQNEYRNMRSLHMARLDSAGGGIRFDVYADLDADEDDTTLLPDRPPSRQTTSTVGSSSTGSVDRALMTGELGAVTTRNSALDAAESVPVQFLTPARRSLDAGDDFASSAVTNNTSSALTSVAEQDFATTGGEQTLLPASSESRRRRVGCTGGRRHNESGSSSGSNGTGAAADSNHHSELKVSASEPIMLRRNQSSWGSDIDGRRSLSSPTDVQSTKTTSPGALFVVGDSESTTPLSSAASLLLTASSGTRCADADGDLNDDDAGCPPDSVDHGGQRRRSPPSSSSSSMMAADEFRGQHSTLPINGTMTSSSSGGRTGDRSPATFACGGVAADLMVTTTTTQLHKKQMLLEQQQQQQQQPAGCQSPLRRCLVDKELVLNSSALETS